MPKKEVPTAYTDPGYAEHGSDRIDGIIADRELHLAADRATLDDDGPHLLAQKGWLISMYDCDRLGLRFKDGRVVQEKKALAKGQAAAAEELEGRKLGKMMAGPPEDKAAKKEGDK